MRLPGMSVRRNDVGDGVAERATRQGVRANVRLTKKHCILAEAVPDWSPPTPHTRLEWFVGKVRGAVQICKTHLPGVWGCEPESANQKPPTRSRNRRGPPTTLSRMSRGHPLPDP
jgi:hypothetical protein